MSLSPKKLNLFQIHKLYSLLGKGFGEKILADEVTKMLINLPREDIKQSMILMYGDTVSLNNPLKIAIDFINGLKKNEFFSYQEFLEKLNGRSK